MSEALDANRITYVCRKCRSTDLRFDRTVVWNPETKCFDALDKPPFAQAELCNQCGSTDIEQLICETVRH